MWWAVSSRAALSWCAAVGVFPRCVGIAGGVGGGDGWVCVLCCGVSGVVSGVLLR